VPVNVAELHNPPPITGWAKAGNASIPRIVTNGAIDRLFIFVTFLTQTNSTRAG
jgi:hypothetical protein